MTVYSKIEKPINLFSYVNLVHAIAGGCGSAFAMTTFYPLDIVRTRLQLEDEESKNTFSQMLDIYRQEGIYGLYRGLLPVIESLYCSNFVYFYTFHALTRVANREKSAIKNLLLGMIAGCVNVLTTTPLWVVNTRIKMQGRTKLYDNQSGPKKYKGLLHGLLKIWKEEGLLSLWSGTLSSLILVINPAIQFMTYEAIKKRMEKVTGGSEVNAAMAFGAGALAKAIATIFTYPLQLVQTKQRHGQSSAEQKKHVGIISMMLYIVKLQGARGLFKGLEAKILQTVSTAALMFVFYEKITHYVFFALMRSKKHT